MVTGAESKSCALAVPAVAVSVTDTAPRRSNHGARSLVRRSPSRTVDAKTSIPSNRPGSPSGAISTTAARLPSADATLRVQREPPRTCSGGLWQPLSAADRNDDLLIAGVAVGPLQLTLDRGVILPCRRIDADCVPYETLTAPDAPPMRRTVTTAWPLCSVATTEARMTPATPGPARPSSPIRRATNGPPNCGGWTIGSITRPRTPGVPPASSAPPSGSSTMSRTTGTVPKSAGRSTHVAPAFPNCASSSPLACSRTMTAPGAPLLVAGDQDRSIPGDRHRRRVSHRVGHGVS